MADITHTKLSIFHRLVRADVTGRGEGEKCDTGTICHIFGVFPTVIASLAEAEIPDV